MSKTEDSKNWITMCIFRSWSGLESLFRIQRWFQVILQSKVALNSVRIIVRDLQNSGGIVLNSWLVIYFLAFGKHVSWRPILRMKLRLKQKDLQRSTAWTKIGILRHILAQISNIKFHEEFVHDIKILFTNECTLYWTYKMLKFTIKTSIHSLLHVSVHLDHPQGAYADPC
jgi:hypothetical protein